MLGAFSVLLGTRDAAEKWFTKANAELDGATPEEAFQRGLIDEAYAALINHVGGDIDLDF